MVWDAITRDLYDPFVTLRLERFLSPSPERLHKPMVLNLGWFCPQPPRGHLVTSRDIFVCHKWGEGAALPAPSGYRPRMLLNIPQVRGQYPQQRISWYKKMSTVLRLRKMNTDSDIQGAWNKWALTVIRVSNCIHGERQHVSFIHSFNRHLLSVTNISDPTLGLQIQWRTKQERPLPFMGLKFQWQIPSKIASGTQKKCPLGFSVVLCASRHHGHSLACHVGRPQQK